MIGNVACENARFAGKRDALSKLRLMLGGSLGSCSDFIGIRRPGIGYGKAEARPDIAMP